MDRWRLCPPCAIVDTYHRTKQQQVGSLTPIYESKCGVQDSPARRQSTANSQRRTQLADTAPSRRLRSNLQMAILVGLTSTPYTDKSYLNSQHRLYLTFGDQRCISYHIRYKNKQEQAVICLTTVVSTSSSPAVNSPVSFRIFAESRLRQVRLGATTYR